VGAGLHIRAFATTAATALALVAGPALAHPHIFIDAKARIIFDDNGSLAAIENSWTFDEAFSAWQIQGLDTNGDGITSPEEMQELADENMIGLAEYQFYTFAGEGEENIDFVAGGNARFVHENGRSTLTFGVKPKTHYRIRNVLEIAINDPEYYVAITFADLSTVTLENAPAGCSVQLDPPETMDDALAEQLYSLPPSVTQLPPELAAALRGVQGAIIVDCAGAAMPAAAPADALEAVTQVAQAKPAMPFGGPPPEPGLVMPKTGLFGWIAEQQRSFYQAMTAALGALQRDNNAFWLLGSLSFLYGVFHAAGPGHGKVVISSYVLATEQQVRRGIALSFASAMLQSAVAIGFVLVAAAVLSLTAAAMNDAANWIGIASYALVAALGLWLIARKLFGWGHSHAAPARRDLAGEARAHLHDHAHEHGHDHGHYRHDDAGHDHVHVVTPAQTSGGWREQLGVVLAVGLRPCSGALVVLAFALSQGVVLAGIVSVLLMGLGTGVTVAVLATLAVSMKGFARRAGGGNAALANGIVWWAELAGAMLVFAFGILLLLASI
jgi:nickel/cobalt transporter (NicO) family protein